MLSVRCVYSIEAVPEESVGEPEEVETLAPGGRERHPMGSMSCITGIMGLTLAREVIMGIIATPLK